MAELTAADELLTQLRQAQQALDAGFDRLPPSPPAELGPDAAQVLAEVADRLRDNDPYQHPLYAGQMLKPPHPIARAAYALAMSLNPNNHALDGGRASSAMELEAIAAIARMFGWPQHLGHLTSGGTFANLEALWIAGQLHPGLTIAASDQAHYTHSRISAVLGLPFVSIPTDVHGRMDLSPLKHALQTNQIGTVVVTLGTTAIGALDPLDRILDLQSRHNFRIHVDAAYGGYFTLAQNLQPHTRAALDAATRVDSLVIDPHKHGLQPYGCGCVLFRDPSVGRFYKHDSPYTYFTSNQLHLGEISLECSRPGASAVALWATQRLLPYEPGGTFARGLESGRNAALSFRTRLATDPSFVLPIAEPELDIVFWTAAAPTTAESSTRARAIFEEARNRDLYLALAELPTRFFPAETWPTPPPEGGHVTCLRSVLMKPEHQAWLDEIWRRLQLATSDVR
jgi:glutamate/tyrosine decarboxylase-like PLP-dependent enzyme